MAGSVLGWRVCPRPGSGSTGAGGGHIPAQAGNGPLSGIAGGHRPRQLRRTEQPMASGCGVQRVRVLEFRRPLAGRAHAGRHTGAHVGAGCIRRCLGTPRHCRLGRDQRLGLHAEVGQPGRHRLRTEHAGPECTGSLAGLRVGARRHRPGGHGIRRAGPRRAVLPDPGHRQVLHAGADRCPGHRCLAHRLQQRFAGVAHAG